MPVTRVFDILTKIDAEFSSKTDLLCSKDKKTGWKCFSAKEFVVSAHAVAAGLLEKGIEPGDRVAIISNNRPEWNFVDFACLQTGTINTPLYPTISDHDLKYVIAEAELRYFFVADEAQYRKVKNDAQGYAIDEYASLW